MANNDSPTPPKVGSSFVSFALSILAILAFRWLLFEPFVIPSGSMIPTLLIHDHILVSKSSYGVRIPFTKIWLLDFGMPKRGDTIVFNSLEGSYFMIKRVIGLPGDTVEMDDNGFVKVNGARLEYKALPEPSEGATQVPYYNVTQGIEGDLGKPYSAFDFFEEKTGDHTHRTIIEKFAPRLSSTNCRPQPEKPEEAAKWEEVAEMSGSERVPPKCWGAPGHPFHVPDGNVFVMGDNRDNSRDSRYWGPVPKEYMMGKALFIWLSCEETLPYVPFLCNPLALRWKRFFHVLE